jgi:hypothetical protein
MKAGGKQHSALNGLHSVISQKIVIFITTAVRTSNPTEINIVLQIGQEIIKRWQDKECQNTI